MFSWASGTLNLLFDAKSWYCTNRMRRVHYKTSQRWHPFSASILKICLQCLPGGDELILHSLPALWETIKDDLWIGILESPWRFLIFYKDVSRMLRFRIMSRLLLWDYTHLLASQIYVHVTPQNRSVEGCKTLDVWRETTCSSLFPLELCIASSQSQFTGMFFYFKSCL